MYDHLNGVMTELDCALWFREGNQCSDQESGTRLPECALRLVSIIYKYVAPIWKNYQEVGSHCRLFRELLSGFPDKFL
jgi:hypothetical protein